MLLIKYVLLECLIIYLIGAFISFDFKWVKNVGETGRIWILGGIIELFLITAGIL